MSILNLDLWDAIEIVCQGNEIVISTPNDQIILKFPYVVELPSWNYTNVGETTEPVELKVVETRCRHGIWLDTECNLCKKEEKGFGNNQV